VIVTVLAFFLTLWLNGGDIAFAVGFVVGGAVYAGIRRVATGTNRDPVPAASAVAAKPMPGERP
jgi:hypothetical protein